MLRKIALAFGIVMVIVGLMGFVPALTPTSDGVDKLLGLFPINAVSNLIHLATGIVAIIASQTSAVASRMFFKVFGIVYALVTVIGFVQGETVLGLLPTDTAYNLLHLAITAFALYVGFGLRSDDDDDLSVRSAV